MQPFISAEFADLLMHNQLHTFAQLWAKQFDWFEEPNQRSGGWSGVGRLQLIGRSGETQVVFLKKQQNYKRRTLKNFIQGEPTLRREFERLQFLRAQQINVPVVIFYAEGVVNNQQCAILLTALLSEYVDLTTICLDWMHQASREDKRLMLQRVAIAIREFHKLGLTHRAMYPKHIFVKNQSTNIEVAFIDLEKSRFAKYFKHKALHDLAALYKRMTDISATDKIFFLHHYFATESFNGLQKKIIHAVIKRSEK